MVPVDLQLHPPSRYTSGGAGGIFIQLPEVGPAHPVTVGAGNIPSCHAITGSRLHLFMVQQHLQQKVDTAILWNILHQDQSNQDQEMNGQEVEKVDQVEEHLRIHAICTNCWSWNTTSTKSRHSKSH